MKALVLCAGYGSRLGALTRNMPKAMLDIGGEPLLSHTLRYLATYGVNEVAINLHFHAAKIRSHFGTRSSFGQRLQYLEEPKLLGTAGTVEALAPFFAPDDNFWVLYGDLLLNEDLAAMLEQHHARDAAATLLVHRRAGSNSLLRVAEDGRITDFIERPTEEERANARYEWVNSGVQILNRRLLAWIPERRPADLPRDVYIPALASERFFAYPLQGYRCAIDSVERYSEAQAAFAEGRYRR